MAIYPEGGRVWEWNTDRHVYYAHELRMDQVATHWNDSLYLPRGEFARVSPILVSCADYGDKVQLMNRQVKWPGGSSHERRGLNAGFYDGSARWLDYADYKPQTQNVRSSRYYHDAHMQWWARDHAQP
jgi:hypothetical protein